MTTSRTVSDAAAATVQKARGLSIAMAAVLIALGVMAIAEPMIAGLAAAILVGWVLTLAGIAHAIAAFGGGLARAIWQAILAVVYVAGGLYFIAHPLIGLGTLTLFLAGILLVQAVLQVISYLQARSDGTGWRLSSGIITLLLAIMIWRRWPSSAIWAIGTLVGVNLLVTGFSQLALGASTWGPAERRAV